MSRIATKARRALWPVIACIALGTVTNVLVAWMFEFIRIGESGLTLLLVDVPGADNVRAYRDTWIGREDREIRAYTYASTYRETGYYGFARVEPPIAVRAALWNQTPLRLGRRDFVDRYETGLGFPFVCLYKWASDGSRYHGAFSIPQFGKVRQRGPGTTLPYLPLWPQLIANTLFWSTLWGVALFVPGAVRRRVRRRRGQCAACGYDLSASGGICPECGASASHIAGYTAGGALRSNKPAQCDDGSSPR